MNFPYEGKVYRCVRCRKPAEGRFCNAFRRDSGWSQGSTHVSWYCWGCVPFGQAYRPKEEGEMPRAARLAQTQDQPLAQDAEREKRTA